MATDDSRPAPADDTAPSFDRARRSRLFRPEVAEEVDDELAFHLEMRARDHAARGVPRAEAQALARREFGDVDRVRRECTREGITRERTMRIGTYLDELRQDATFALRQLRRAPGFAAAAVLTLALGIGATTTVFGLVRGVLLAPLPYAAPEGLLTVRTSLPDARDLQDRLRGRLTGAAIWASNQERLGSAGGEVERVLAAQVTAEFFDVLGVGAQIGRTLRPDDADAPVAVLAHGLWQRRFGGDPGIVGRTILLGGRSVTVVGVMPASFAYPGRRFGLWVPLEGALAGAPSFTENRALRIFTLVVRLAPGVAEREVAEQARGLATLLERAYPDSNAGVSLSMVPLEERIVGEARLPLLVLLSGVGLLLLIACANIATLVLARATERGGEVAVRAALGASRARLIRQGLTESLVLAALGGTAGGLLAALGSGAVARLLDDVVPRTDALGMDAWLLATAAGLTLTTGLAAGLAPALLGSSVGTQPLLETGRGHTGGARGRRAGATFTALQVALALVLLVSATLLARSLVRLAGSPAGFVADRLMTTHVVLEGRETGEHRADTVDRLMRQLASVPGVESVGAATGQPTVNAQRGTRFAVDGVTALTGQPAAYFIPATPNYFRALGAELRDGRAFTSDDRAGAPPVVIVSETLARRIAPGGSAVGRRLRLVNPEQDDAWRTIVGVVPDIRYNGLDDPGESTIYAPFAQTPFMWVYVFVRTADDSAALGRAIAAAVAAVDPGLRPPQVQPMRALVDEAVSPWVVNAVVVGSFAGGAVLLAAIGIAGLVGRLVARQRAELAVRQALGATPRAMVRLALGHALAPVVVGAVAGLAASLAAVRLLQGLLYGVTPHDPLTFAASGAGVVAVALTAAWVPARRAARVSAADALRLQ